MPEYNCNPFEAKDKPFCGPDNYYDKAKGQCVPCPCAWSKGWVVAPGGGCEFFYSGKPCCPGQPLDTPCLSDRVWNDKGECVSAALPHCPQLFGPLSKYDAATGLCVCPEGYERSEAQHACLKKGGSTPSGPSSPSGTAGTVAAVLLALGAAAGTWWLGQRMMGASTEGQPNRAEDGTETNERDLEVG